MSNLSSHLQPVQGTTRRSYGFPATFSISGSRPSSNNQHRWYQRTAAQCNCANEAVFFPQEQTQQGTVSTWQRKGNTRLHYAKVRLPSVLSRSQLPKMEMICKKQFNQTTLICALLQRGTNLLPRILLGSDLLCRTQKSGREVEKICLATAFH